MTSRDQRRCFSAPTGVLNSRGGMRTDMALGGARPLDALALPLSGKTWPEARFHLVRKMMGLRLRLSRELSAGFVALSPETTGQFLLQSSVIVPHPPFLAHLLS